MNASAAQDITVLMGEGKCGDLVAYSDRIICKPPSKRPENRPDDSPSDASNRIVRVGHWHSY